MTRADRPDSHSDGPPRTTWGPGKSAALSLAAFAVIFGIFTHVRRDAADAPANGAHAVSGPIRTTGPKTGKAVAAAPPPVGTATHATSGTSRSDMKPPVSVVIEPEAAPRIAPPSAASAGTRPARLLRRSASDLRVARNSGKNSPIGQSYADARRRPAAHDHAGSKARVDIASRPSASARTTRSANVTPNELNAARALARARMCANIEQWHCVEQSASRALALDPGNGESRALLGQAIRNRL